MNTLKRGGINVCSSLISLVFERAVMNFSIIIKLIENISVLKILDFYLAYIVKHSFSCIWMANYK